MYFSGFNRLSISYAIRSLSLVSTFFFDDTEDYFFWVCEVPWVIADTTDYFLELYSPLSTAYCYSASFYIVGWFDNLLFSSNLSISSDDLSLRIEFFFSFITFSFGLKHIIKGLLRRSFSRVLKLIGGNNRLSSYADSFYFVGFLFLSIVLNDFALWRLLPELVAWFS